MADNQATSYSVRMEFDDEFIEFNCRSDQSIARAAQAAGYELTVGCMQARCMTCRSIRAAGQVRCIRPLSKHATIDPADIEGGFVLVCSVAPQSDVVLKPASRWVHPAAEEKE